MGTIPHLRSNATKVVVVLAILGSYAFSKPSVLSPADESRLANRFQFTPHTIAPFPVTDRNVRAVNPNLEHISGWISAVGAAVALMDWDGDGLPNDVCHVDPRNDLITVSPVPGTGERFDPFVLDPSPLPYDANTMAPMGCLPVDLNEDGYTDLLVYYWGRTPIVFLQTESGGYRPFELTTSQERWYTNAATAADLDGDGHVDLVIANYFPDGARILDAQATVPDVMPRSMSRAFNGGSTRFFLWTKAKADPGFRMREIEDVLPESYATAWTLAVGAADLDNDLLPELYFANDFGPDRLLHNRSRPGKLEFVSLVGRRGLTTPASKVLGRGSFKGMGVDFADLNGDGLLDIYVSNIAAEYALQESHFVFLSTGQLQDMSRGIAPYIDNSESLGLSRSDWSWEIRLADFNNDGVMEAMQATGFLKGTINRWPELQELATGNDELMPLSQVWFQVQPGDDLSGHSPNHFFVRHDDGRYYNIASAAGLARPQVTRGIATADVNGNGKIDFATANQWEDSHFYRNDCRDCGSFLGLYLRLPPSGQHGHAFSVHGGSPTARSRPAIGASAHVTLPDGTVRVGQVDGGNGHSGVRSTQLHFGLGSIEPDARLQVRLRWRDTSGTPRSHELDLEPGWHTVMLGRLPGEEF